MTGVNSVGAYGMSAGWPAVAPGKTAGATGNSPRQLSADEQKQIDQLAATDRKVRAHEQAHVSAGGELVRGGASFTYQRGPDGKSYAVAGEVQIDTSAGKDASATLSKAARIRAAALAPADPSSQDRQVAAEAGRMEIEAQAEMRLAAVSGENGADASRGKRGAAYAAGSATTPASRIDAYA